MHPNEFGNIFMCNGNYGYRRRHRYRVECFCARYAIAMQRTVRCMKADCHWAGRLEDRDGHSCSGVIIAKLREQLQEREAQLKEREDQSAAIAALKAEVQGLAVLKAQVQEQNGLVDQLLKNRHRVNGVGRRGGSSSF